MYFLIKRGILNAEVRADSNRPALQISQDTLDQFIATYVFLSTIAREWQTTSDYLIQLFIDDGVTPVSGPTVDGGRRYLFKKRDIRRIDIPQLLSKAKALTTSISRDIMSSGEAAKRLGITIKDIQTMVNNEILHPYSGTYFAKEKDLYFSKWVIDKFSKVEIDYVSLVAPAKAAKMLEVSISQFRLKYVQAGTIKPIHLNKTLMKGSRRRSYFLMGDIEKLIRTKQ